MKNQKFGSSLIILAAVLWALDGITRRSLYHLPPVIIVFYEHLIGLILLSPFVTKILANQKLTKKVWTLSLVIGLMGGLLGTLFITTALMQVQFVAFSVVFLIQKIQPLFTITSAHFLLKEKIDKRYFKWALLAIISVFFVTFPNGQINFSTGAGTIWAALFSLGAAFFWGTGTTISKMLVGEISDKAATLMRYFTATIFALLAVFILGSGPSISIVGPSEAARLTFIALTTGLVAMFMYYKGLRLVEAKVSTILELSFPLIAVFVDMFLYKTFLAPSQYLAAGVLMFAMIKVSQLQTKKS